MPTRSPRPAADDPWRNAEGTPIARGIGLLYVIFDHDYLITLPPPRPRAQNAFAIGQSTRPRFMLYGELARAERIDRIEQLGGVARLVAA